MLKGLHITFCQSEIWTQYDLVQILKSNVYNRKEWKIRCNKGSTSQNTCSSLDWSIQVFVRPWNCFVSNHMRRKFSYGVDWSFPDDLCRGRLRCFMTFRTHWNQSFASLIGTVFWTKISKLIYSGCDSGPLSILHTACVTSKTYLGCAIECLILFSSVHCLWNECTKFLVSLRSDSHSNDLHKNSKTGCHSG